MTLFLIQTSNLLGRYYFLTFFRQADFGLGPGMMSSSWKFYRRQFLAVNKQELCKQWKDFSNRFAIIKEKTFFFWFCWTWLELLKMSNKVYNRYRSFFSFLNLITDCIVKLYLEVVVLFLFPDILLYRALFGWFHQYLQNDGRLNSLDKSWANFNLSSRSGVQMSHFPDSTILLNCTSIDSKQILRCVIFVLTYKQVVILFISSLTIAVGGSEIFFTAQWLIRQKIVRVYFFRANFFSTL